MPASVLWHACRLVTELCDRDLVKFVRRASEERQKPGLPVIDVVLIGLMLCSALSAVHNNGRSLHLDVKPNNVLVVKSARKSSGSAAAAGPDYTGAATDRYPEVDGEAAYTVRLCDFQLAHIMNTSVSTKPRTHQQVKLEGNPGASPGYSPKEQLQRNAVVACHTDVYSMGATLLFSASGKPPFHESIHNSERVYSMVRAGAPS